jgi:hypothetical protein
LEIRGYSWKIAAALGLVLGMTMLTRAVGQVFFGAVLIYIVLIRYEMPRVIRWRAGFIILAVGCLTVAPWMIRNGLEMGSFSLNTNGGINLFIGNNPDANGSYKFTPEMEQTIPQRGEAGTSRAAAEMAWKYIRENPKHSVDMMGRKFAFLWASDALLWIHYNPPEGPPSVAARLRMLPIWKLLIMSVPYMLLVGFGISGYYLVRHFDGRGLLILATALTIAAVLLTHGVPRYHIPLMPGIIVGAGALVRPQVWDSVPVWRRLFLLFTLGMFLGLWLYEAMAIAGVYP